MKSLVFLMASVVMILLCNTEAKAQCGAVQAAPVAVYQPQVAVQAVYQQPHQVLVQAQPVYAARQVQIVQAAQPVYAVRQVQVVQAQPVYVMQQRQFVAVQQHSQFVGAQQFRGNGRVRNGGGGALNNVFDSILSPQGILTIGGAAAGAAVAGPGGAVGGAAIGAALGNVLGNGLQRR